MPADLGWIWVPLLACVVLTGIHAWLGIHVLARGVVFVDLALAQIAALGAVVALLAGFDPGTTGSWCFALGFTIAGAAVFALTRTRDARVPQEAIIGVVYAVASAAAIVLMSRVDDLHAVEKIRSILSGRSIVFVEIGQVLETAGIYAAVAIVHIVFRREFLLVSLEPETARKRGMRLLAWDFVFYATFGIVISSSVQIAGVLLVFSFLIVPSIVGSLCATQLRSRLLIGWATGLCASACGLVLSYELPSGPVVVVSFGTVLVIASLARFVALAESRGRALLRVGLGVGLVALVTLGLVVAPWPAKRAAGHADAAAAAPDAKEIRRMLAAGRAAVRETGLTAFSARAEPALLGDLFDALAKETDPDLALHMAEEGMKLGDRRFLGELVERLRTLESLFYREEAVHLLAEFTDVEFGGPVGEPELARLRAWWNEAGPRLRWDESRRKFAR